MIFLALTPQHRYIAAVTHMVTGRENSSKKLAHSAQDTISGVFFGLKYRFMVAVCGQASVWLGSNFPSILTPHTAATQSREKDRDGSNLEVGALPMHFSLIQNTSATTSKAAAHRAMAIAALHADSSLSIRLKRYNAHMEQARTLETVGGAA
jgi:hypothetical protein